MSWSKHYTDDGDEYYYNEHTQISQWDRPDEYTSDVEEATLSNEYHSEHADPISVGPVVAEDSIYIDGEVMKEHTANREATTLECYADSGTADNTQPYPDYQGATYQNQHDDPYQTQYNDSYHTEYNDPYQTQYDDSSYVQQQQQARQETPHDMYAHQTYPSNYQSDPGYSEEAHQEQPEVSTATAAATDWYHQQDPWTDHSHPDTYSTSDEVVPPAHHPQDTTPHYSTEEVVESPAAASWTVSGSLYGTNGGSLSGYPHGVSYVSHSGVTDAEGTEETAQPYDINTHHAVELSAMDIIHFEFDESADLLDELTRLSVLDPPSAVENELILDGKWSRVACRKLEVSREWMYGYGKCVACGLISRYFRSSVFPPPCRYCSHVWRPPGRRRSGSGSSPPQTSLS